MTATADLREFALRRCEYFEQIGLLPLRADGFEAARWLDNFEEPELDHALHLLNSFVYLPKRITRQALEAAVHGLSRRITVSESDAQSGLAAWRDFLAEVIFLPVRGELPRLTDSGMHFIRMVRDRFDLPEESCPAAVDAIVSVMAEPRKPVVFVDDFVGTGGQFVSTFKYRHQLPDGSMRSFEDLAANDVGRYCCCPVVACARGLRLIARRCPSVVVSPGYELPDAYGAFAADSIIWPKSLVGTAEQFLEVASRRAGIPDDPTNRRYWRGYGGLGLALAFDHGPPPDATLPLLTWTENDWQPLLRMAA